MDYEKFKKEIRVILGVDAEQFAQLQRILGSGLVEPETVARKNKGVT